VGAFRASTGARSTFFGEVDAHGEEAVEFFTAFDHDRVSGEALEHLMMYMSTQKLRTPKGLDWLVAQAGARDREDVLDHLTTLRTVYGAICAECVWQIADAATSSTKFIVSDHPVSVSNRSCAPVHPWCKGANDPDIRLHATHTLFRRLTAPVGQRGPQPGARPAMSSLR
jgi:hypothetical protein